MKAKPKTRVVQMVTEEIDAIPGDVSDVADEVLAALDDGNGADRWQVRVYQREGTDDSHIFDCTPSEIDDLPNRCREMFGSGKFRVIVRRNNMIFRKKDFATKAPPGWRAPQLQQEAKPAIDPGLAAILQRMDERAERSEQAMRALLEKIAQPQQPPGASPFDMVDKMMGTMKSMMETMGGAKSESMFDAVMKGVELRDKLAGAGEGGSNFYDIVRDGLSQLPAVVDILKNLPKSPPVVMAPPARQLAAAPAQQQTDQFAAQVQMLVERARAGKSPETYATLLLEELPAEWIAGLLAQRDPVAVFASLNPEVTVHQDWFSSMVDILRELVQDDGALLADEGERSLADGNGTVAPAASPVGAAGR